MDFYFPVETDPQMVLEVLRFWRMEYRVDGFVLMGDGVWMELLARDSVLADVKLIGCGYDMVESQENWAEKNVWQPVTADSRA